MSNEAAKRAAERMDGEGLLNPECKIITLMVERVEDIIDEEMHEQNKQYYDLLAEVRELRAEDNTPRRERIAAATMQGLLADGSYPATGCECIFALDVVRIADAMIAELDKEKQ